MSITARKNERAAFTLIELLLVVVLLGVLTGVVFPRLKGSVRAAALEQAAEGVADLVRFSRAEAVRRGLKVRMSVTTGGDAVELALQNEESSGGEGYTSFADSFLDAEHRLPQGVRIARIEENERAVRDKVLTFNPDGIHEPATIRLMDGEGRAMLVQIGAWKDEVSVSRDKAGS